MFSTNPDKENLSVLGQTIAESLSVEIAQEVSRAMATDLTLSPVLALQQVLEETLRAELDPDIKVLIE